MISENIAGRLCDRLVSRHATPYDVTQIMTVLVAVCETAERLNKLDGLFDAISKALSIPRYHEVRVCLFVWLLCTC